MSSDGPEGSVDRKGIKALPEDERKREVQLGLTAQKAIRELVEDIDRKAKGNLAAARKKPADWVAQKA